MKTLGETLSTKYYQEFLAYNGKRYTIINPYEDTKSLHLKGQLHCHSNASADGTPSDTPTVLVTAYKTAGYDFVTITDHEVITSDPAVSGITWMGNSIEETCNRHVIAYDVSAATSLTSAQEALSFHKANNKLTSLPHPNWAYEYIIERPEMTTLYDYDFTEVYNKYVDAYGEDQWDYALTAGKKTFAFAVDDCHNSGSGAQFNGGWIVVHTNTNSKSAIWDSIREGNFYSSNGNDITISVSNGVVTASSTASSNFIFYGKNGRQLKTENAVTSSQYTIVGDEMYIRVRSQKVSNSTYAWSQPIFINVLGNEDKEAATGKVLGMLSGMDRNAIVNGNFSEWNQGTSLALTADAAVNFLADHWQFSASANGGTLPTLTQSRQTLDIANIENGLYNWRITTSGAGTSLGTSHFGFLEQRVERAPSYLSNLGRRMTLSFLARSDISNKKLGVFATHVYGTGGSPSSSDLITGTNWTLTAWWKRYTYTFDMPDITGKTFGTNNDDFVLVRFYFAWGSAIQSRVGASGGETWVGAGYVDIAQVQWYQESEELPFMAEKLVQTSMEVKRYSYVVNSVSTTEAVGYGNAVSTTVAYIAIPLPTEMRAVPTLTATAGDWQLDDGINTPVDVTAIAMDDNGFSSKKLAVLKVTVASGLTAFRNYWLVADGNAGRKLILSAEQ